MLVCLWSMTSSIIMMHLNTKQIACVVCTLIIMTGVQCAISAEDTSLRYSETVKSLNRDMYGVDAAKLKKEAEKYFYSGINSKDNQTKEAYLSKALAKYMLLLKFKPDDVMFCTQVGIINHSLGQEQDAEQYFKRAISIDLTNPYANFNFADFYFSRREYFEALDYYLAAYRNGYKSYYELNIKLAQVYERLGDIDKAKQFYIKSQKLNPNEQWISKKIKTLDKIYYSKSDFKQ